MKDKNTTRLVKEYLVKYKDSNSIYYQELKKSYEEFVHIKDSTTKELYIKHLEELCELLKSQKNASKTITMLTIFSLFIVILATFITIKYNELAASIKDNIPSKASSTTLSVNYENTDRFTANNISDEYHYLNLEPLIIKIFPYNKSGKQNNFHYDVYLIEENESLPKESILGKESLFYHVKVNNKESTIKQLKNATLNDKGILIYSGETLTNKEESINLRMWNKNNLDSLNKNYKFKLFIEGYTY